VEVSPSNLLPVTAVHLNYDFYPNPIGSAIREVFLILQIFLGSLAISVKVAVLWDDIPYLPPPLTTSSLDTYINLILLPLGLLIPDDGGSTHL
jgi:hypothetical protein